jgi:hypothetical protein
MSKKSQFDGLLKNAFAQQTNQEEDIKKSIVIDRELQEWISPLSTDEYAQLKQNILQNGCLDKLLVWKKSAQEYILVDGHNRYQICKDLGINFQIAILEFPDKEAAKLFMLTHQMGRRNLTIEQLSYLRGKRYEQEKAPVSNPMGINQSSKLKDKMSFNSDIDNGQNNLVKGQNVLQQEIDNSDENLVKGQNVLQQKTDKTTTAEKLAQEYHVSDKTIQRDYEFAKGLDKVGVSNPELKQAILSGTIKVKKEVLQTLSKIEINEPIENVEDLLKMTNPKVVNTVIDVPTKELKEALKKTQKQVFVVVKGQWLLDNDLVSYWQKVRKINKVIDADFEDILTWEEAKDIFKG